MTTLEDLSKYSSGDKLPGFAFKRIGDAVKGIVDRAQLVEVKNDTGTRTKLVIELTVTAAKGGIPEFDADGILTGVKDFEAGDKVAVWLPSGFGIGAMSEAVKAAGARGIDIGAEVSVKLTERKDTGKAKPANVYACTYKAPAVSLDPTSDPF
jgi:hypothetical protein